jgi:hypothetical protein
MANFMSDEDNVVTAHDFTASDTTAQSHYRSKYFKYSNFFKIHLLKLIYVMFRLD